MATEIVVPELGESVVEATVARWLVQEGDAVKAGDPVVELETDKVDLEVAAEADGVLASIKRQDGEDVEIGDVLGVIEESATAAQEAPEEEGPEEVEPEEAQPEKAERAETEEAERKPEEADQAGGDKVTPVARRMAAEQDVDLSRVSGSGAGGRVTKQDVESHIQQRQAAAEAEEEPAAAAQPRRTEEVATPPAVSGPLFGVREERREERVRMSRRRRTIAKRLVEAQQTAAILTTFNEIDMSAVMDLRKRRRDAFEDRHGVRLGFMSFFVKASIGALKAFPPLNAEIDGDEMVLKHYYDIGIAVGAEEGLVVPVLRDADRMSFADVESGIREMAQKAQDGSLSLTDLQGGTFTITNGGVFGSLLSTPILNPPQVGILGLHKIEERPVVVAGEIEVRPMMYVALSYDHRIVDGREAVQFLVKLKELIEDPEVLLLEG